LVGGGQSSPFPIDFAGRLYNSAMLPRALWYYILAVYVAGIVTKARMNVWPTCTWHSYYF